MAKELQKQLHVARPDFTRQRPRWEWAIDPTLKDSICKGNNGDNGDDKEFNKNIKGNIGKAPHPPYERFAHKPGEGGLAPESVDFGALGFIISRFPVCRIMKPRIMKTKGRGAAHRETVGFTI